VLRARPTSCSEAVTEFHHGIAITDPYRWLEDQDSPRTRTWIEEQTRHARAYFDSIPNRDNCRQRIRELLSVETYDSLHKVGNQYFFRRRLPNQQQPCICMREGPEGDDEILIDPAMRGEGAFSAVKPLTISHDGRFLLYEIKQGGQRAGRFEIFDVVDRRTRSDALPLGYLRGFEFAPDCKSFYYVHEGKHAYQPAGRAVRHHTMDTDFREDTTLFSAVEGTEVRVSLLSDSQRLGILVFRFLDKTYTDFHVHIMAGREAPTCVLKNAEFLFAPQMIGGRTLALTDHQASNLRIVEVRDPVQGECSFREIVPQREGRIREWSITGKQVYIRYVLEAKTRIEIFDLNSERPRQVGKVACHEFETVRLIGSSPEGDEVFLEAESFTNRTRIYRCGLDGKRMAWGRRSVGADGSGFEQLRVSYRAKDGTSVPIFLFGGRDTLLGGSRPVIMTAYGGYGIPMTPQFSVLVSFLVERGCLFALPNIRGGSEFGEKWHQAAQRRNRQVAFDDFVAAAEWLIDSGWTTPGKLAIFGGSNSGLLVGVALTQRPDLFRAALCMVPLLDMLRYHLFDAASGKQEFGTADDPDDFAVLLSYSPYHQVRDGVAYPATMIVSGDSDEKCNPLHARKMTARLQMASSSEAPIVLDYSRLRGHSPVLPLDFRIDALTDRVSFLCDQLQLLK